MNLQTITLFGRPSCSLHKPKSSIFRAFCNVGNNLSAPALFGTQGAVDQGHELFEYTSGRWIFNESLRLAERRLSFNVDELKNVAARSVHKPVSDITSLRKVAEGGFNRIFELCMKDGTSILARLPYPTTIPRRLAVASEVATMDFVRAHGIPTPRILGYAIDENPVGSEYILMEKLPGRPIGDAWFHLSESQRLQILHDVIKLEAKLFDIQLPASGSIYYSRDLDARIPKAEIIGTDGQFCVGPYTGGRWWHGERENLACDRGPHTESLRAIQAPAEKELAWIRKYGQPRYPIYRQNREAFEYKKQDPMVHVKSLERYLRVAPSLVPIRPELNAPVLRHPDLQPNNIFISDKYRVTSLIDWQHAIVLPAFLAAGIPNSFQNFSDAESNFFSPPKPPPDLDSMDEVERSQAQELFRRRHVHFFYLGFTQQFNPPHWRVLEDPIDLLRRRIYNHAGEPWEGLNTSLQHDLVQVSQNWEKIAPPNPGSTAAPAPPPACPISFAHEEVQRIDALVVLHREADEDIERINGLLGVGSDGWTSNEQFEYAKHTAAAFREQGLASADDEPWMREMSERHWPYDDFDEDE